MHTVYMYQSWDAKVLYYPKRELHQLQSFCQKLWFTPQKLTRTWQKGTWQTLKF